MQNLQLQSGVGVFLAIALLTCGGCRGVTKTYDMSFVDPFSRYTDREVVLPRDAVLLEKREVGAIMADDNITGGIQIRGGAMNSERYFTLALRDTEVEREIAKRWVAYATVPAGTHAVILRTRLTYSRTPLYGVEQTEIYSHVLLKLAIPGFTEWVESRYSYGGFAGGIIHPAPWEPLSTPQMRNIVYPDKQFLIDERPY